jgi:hypothetical protein
LVHEQKVREDYDRFRRESPRRLTSEERERIRALANDIPSLWRDANTSAADRKEILRTLVERVRVTVNGKSEYVDVCISWVGGSVSEHSLRRPVGNYERLADFAKLRERVTAELAAGKTTAKIAETLNREGFHSPSGRLDRFTARRVGMLIYRLGLSKKRPPAERLSANEWWVRDVAEEVGVPVSRLRHWIKNGYIHVRKSEAWGQVVIWADADELSRLRHLRDHPRQNRTAHYPVELIRPKDRSGESRKKGKKRHQRGN